MDNLTNRKIKTLPEWTVPEEICRAGHFRTDCPYSTELEILKEQSYQADQVRLRELGVYKLVDKGNTVLK